MGILGDVLGPVLGAVMSPIQNAWAGNAAQHAMDFTASQQLVAQDFNSAQAQTTRDYQERMSNTQYQRATADMKAAGLNPMLAYSQGGAGTPTGATASSSGGQGTSFNPSNPALSAVSGAQIENMMRQNANIEADTARKDAERKEIEARTPTYAISMEAMQAQIQHTMADINRVATQSALNVSSAAQAEQQTRNLKALLPQIDATVAQLRAQAKLTGDQDKETVQRIQANLPRVEAAYKNVQTALAELQRPQAGMRAATYSTPIGAIGEMLKALSPFTSLAR